MTILSSCFPERNLTDKAQQVTRYETMTIIKPFATCGYYSDFYATVAIEDSVYNSQLHLNRYPKDYRREKVWIDYSNQVYKKYFRKKFIVATQEISPEDSAVLKRFLDKTKVRLHDSSVNTIPLDDSTREVLAKYKGDRFLLVVVEECYLDYFRGINTPKAHDWILFRDFIINPNRNEVEFYRYDIEPYKSLTVWLPPASVLTHFIRKYRWNIPKKTRTK